MTARYPLFFGNKICDNGKKTGQSYRKGEKKEGKGKKRKNGKNATKRFDLSIHICMYVHRRRNLSTIIFRENKTEIKNYE